MNRNIEKNISLGEKLIEKHQNADITPTEICHFYDQFKEIASSKNSFDAFWKVSQNIFNLGVAVGSRNN